MSAASFEQLQRSWCCHAGPASLWRCQPWLTAPAALVQASLPAVTHSLADRPAAAAAAALMSHHEPKAAAPGIPDDLFQASAAVHVFAAEHQLDAARHTLEAAADSAAW